MTRRLVTSGEYSKKTTQVLIKTHCKYLYSQFNLVNTRFLSHHITTQHTLIQYNQIHLGIKVCYCCM
jgi:hypothetical protein